MEKLRAYNKGMFKTNCLTMALFMLVQSLPVLSYGADAEADLTAQQSACSANTAMEWSSTLNRCVGKQSAINTRQDVANCDTITDQSARAKCHMDVAEKNSSLSSDAGSLNQGKTTNSMMMNAITTAYTMISVISNMGKGGQSSSCTSKKILAVTSIGGLASDVFLKMKAKKKVKELTDKYKLDTTIGTSEAQVKALEYLKEEQQTVAEIASMEKKRNLMLIAGYGAAAAFAIYEMTPYGQANGDCMKPNDDQGKTKVEAKADAAPTAASESAPAAGQAAPTINNGGPATSNNIGTLNQKTTPP